jgi:DNA-binding CsgD family transcriptional regulator
MRCRYERQMRGVAKATRRSDTGGRGVAPALRNTPTATDLFRILDAAYDVEQPRERWLDGLMRAVAPILGQGAGVGGLLYDIPGDGQFQVDYLQAFDVPPGWRETGLAIHRDPRFIPKMIGVYRSMLCATLPQLMADPELAPPMRGDYYDHHPVRGQLSINGFDSSGKGCALNLFSEGDVALSEAQRSIFTRLATHLATAYRLQRQFADGVQTKVRGVEAVLTPAGRVEHAEADAKSPEARQELTLAVRQREQTRGDATSDGEPTMRRLRGMVSARWTLVDQFETGGQRYVVARENAPRAMGPALLTPREKQVVSLAALGRTNKVIAYELGLAYATVRVLMARACTKLGASKRAELPGLLRATDSSSS